MTYIEERVHEIERKYAHLIKDLLVLYLTEQTLKLILVLADGTNLRVTERWRGKSLIRYSYYWLDTENSLKRRLVGITRLIISGWKIFPIISILINKGSFHMRKALRM